MGSSGGSHSATAALGQVGAQDSLRELGRSDRPEVYLRLELLLTEDG